VEGRNVAFEYRSSEGHYDRLPALAAEFVRRQVAVIYAGGAPAARAAKAATTTIPIVFTMGEDPVKEGLVASLNRPGGNITGYSNFNNQLVSKRLELLREIAPKAEVLGLLVNPTNPNADPDTKDVQAAADALGLRLQVLKASTERELETAFASIVQQPLGGLLVGVDPWFRERPERITVPAARYSVPAIYERRSFPAAGGLMSYSSSVTEGARQAGIFIARILKGAKPADLPVQRATKFEFVINLKTAKALGLTIPETLLATADEVIQ
jgi:putative tryptophan/tyrosine transport system substrate-binding protein